MLNRLQTLNLALLIITVLLAAGLLLAGCGGKKQEEKQAAPSGTSQATQPSAPTPAPAAPEKEITIAIQSEMTTLDPHMEDGSMRTVNDNIYDTIMIIENTTLKPVPHLVSEVKRVDENHWQFTVRSGVKFQNGDPLTPDDLVFSINRQINPDLKLTMANYFNMIDKAEKIDDKTFQIVTKGPDPVLLTKLTMMKIMSKKYTEANKDQINSKPMGTGPYKLTEWKRGVSAVIETDPNYWGQKPDIKKATYRFIEESATRAAALQSGEVDLALNILPEYIKNMPKIEEIQGLDFPVVRPNMFKGILTNKDLRMAAALALDKQSLADSLYQGHARVAPGQVFKPGYIGFNPNIKPYPYDPEKAKELIKKAGYKGEPLQFVIMGGRWLKDRELSETVAAMLQAVGFNVKTKVVNLQEWLDLLFHREKAPELMLTFTGNEVFDADRTYATFIDSKGLASVYPDKLDARLAELRKEMDLDKRQKGYEEVAQILYDDVALIPLLNINDIYGLSKRLEWKPRQDFKIAVYEMKVVQ